MLNIVNKYLVMKKIGSDDEFRQKTNILIRSIMNVRKHWNGCFLEGGKHVDVKSYAVCSNNKTVNCICTGYIYFLRGVHTKN